MKTYLRILGYARQYKGQIILYTLSTLATVLFSTLTFVLVQPLLEVLFNEAPNYVARPEQGGGIMRSLDDLMGAITRGAYAFRQEYGQGAALLFVTLVVVGTNLLGNIFKFLSNIYLGTLRTRVVENMRADAFRQLIRRDVATLEQSRKGDLLTRLSSDIVEVEHSVVTSFESIIRDPVNIIYVLAIMIYKSWELTLFIFAVLPISAILVAKITKKLKRDAGETQTLMGRILSTVDEAVSGIRVVRAFLAEKYITQLFSRFNSEHSRVARRQWHRRALVPIFSESLMVLAVGLVLWFGGRQVYSGQLGKAEFIAYIGLFFVLSRPAKSLSSSFSNIHKGIASAERVFQLMDGPVEVRDTESTLPCPRFSQALAFQNVDFAYVPGRPVLRDVSLQMQQGKMYGLVGASGSGKSTLAELILRFYDVSAGKITFDGIDIRQLRQEDLRAQMAIVTQDPVLFNDSFYENIAFGMPNVTREDVERAARAANAHDFIMATPQGYNTPVGDRGGLLSGGQRQRISIARAILKNPPFLILDEATSALDNESEKLVQQALSRLMNHRTSLVIAHRLETIRHADTIFVLSEGRLVEAGTHTELLTLPKGHYARLYSLAERDDV